MAYFDSSHDLPEEILMAAGFNVYKILGDVNKSTDPADKFLFQTYCPAARAFLTEAIENPNKWAGIVVGHGCDATNRHYDIWKAHVKTPWIYFVNSPLKTSGKSTIKFYKTELQAFIEAIEKQFNVKITNENLMDAIKTSNQIKTLLQKVNDLRGTKDVSNVEYFDAVLDAIQTEKKYVIEKLTALVENWKSKPEFPSNKKRILLTGSDVTYREWMEYLDEAGFRVVRDDLSIGERYYATTIPNIDDPIDSIIDYYFNIPMPATKHPSDKRLDFLMEAVKTTKIDAIISQNLKFCEPYAFDSVFIRDAFKDKNIPFIHLERDYTSQKDHQFMNRLEAFKEML